MNNDLPRISLDVSDCFVENRMVVGEIGTCQTCRFWFNSSDDGESGHCRRHAPRSSQRHSHIDSEGQIVSIVAIEAVATDKDYWCGDYERRKE